MKVIVKIFKRFSKNARAKRAAIFKRLFQLNAETKILDLGSESGANIHAILQGTSVHAYNVYIADIDESLLKKGQNEFGFVPLLLGESERIPVDDLFFDIVYCSSVIEHVTLPKNQVWSCYSGNEFKEQARLRQREFADEIQRIGRQYFVQTPYKYFPIESHTWLPFVFLLPRSLLIPLLRFTNRFWVKKTSPDWNLLTIADMSDLFKRARIVEEKAFGITKSVMAIKSDSA